MKFKNHLHIIYMTHKHTRDPNKQNNKCNLGTQSAVTTAVFDLWARWVWNENLYFRPFNDIDQVNVPKQIPPFLQKKPENWNRGSFELE